MTTFSEKRAIEKRAIDDLPALKRVSSQAVYPLLLGFSAIVVSIGGHIVTAQRRHVIWGAILFALAIVLFLAPPVLAGAIGLRRDNERAGTVLSRPLMRWRKLRIALLVSGAILAAVAYVSFSDNRLDRGLWLWMAALYYFGVAVVERPAAGWRRTLANTVRVVNWRVVIMLLAITGLAAFFRIFRLASVPVEMTSDHAEKLLDVYDVLNGQRPIFFPRNTGREAFQFYLTAALIRWTPLEIGHLALKVGTALFGIVTVPMSYFLARELYGRNVGLLAAFFLAISHWHVAITRVGLRFPFTAAFTVPALFFLFRALRMNRRNDWLAAGAILGAGLHTYTAMRIVPILFVLIVAMSAGGDLWSWLRGRATAGRMPRTAYPALTLRFWTNALSGACCSLLVFLPLLRYMVENPGIFWYRAASRTEEALLPVEAWRVFWHNVKNALLMFNYRGDVVPANTIPDATVLGPVAGGLFVLGCAYLIWRLLFYRERTAGYLLVSFFVLLLPSVLSLAYPRENPSVVRMGGAIPIVMIIVALPLALLWKRLEQGRRYRRGPAVTLFPLLLLLILAVAHDYDWYFDDYDANIRRSLWNTTELGAVLREFGEEGGQLQNAYHVAYPHWADTRNIAINAGHITWQNAVIDLSQIPEQARQPGRKIYLVHAEDEAALKVLREVYPQGYAQLRPSLRPGKEFIVFVAPQAQG